MPTYDEYLYISECAQTIYLKGMLLLIVIYALTNYLSCICHVSPRDTQSCQHKLELPESWRIHDTFHATLLKPYVETETHRPNYARPPPEIESDEERYEVETILKHRRRG